MRTIHTIHALRGDRRTKDIPIKVFVPGAYDEGASAAFSSAADDLFRAGIISCAKDWHHLAFQLGLSGKICTCDGIQ